MIEQEYDGMEIITPVDDPIILKNKSKAERMHADKVAREKRKSVKETVATKLQNMYDKARRARKAK
tara:strand:+ start:778 stop:975 length:198 start_codon:yes stop_codon:yes gene_type:complete